MGVSNDLFEVGNLITREFSISCDVVYKKDGFKCCLCTVYGAAYEEKKKEFLDELYTLMASTKIPILIGGILIWLDSIVRRVMGWLTLSGVIGLMIG
jgi:hypothetical protein